MSTPIFKIIFYFLLLTGGFFFSIIAYALGVAPLIARLVAGAQFFNATRETTRL